MDVAVTACARCTAATRHATSRAPRRARSASTAAGPRVIASATRCGAARTAARPLGPTAARTAAPATGCASMARACASTGGTAAAARSWTCSRVRAPAPPTARAARTERATANAASRVWRASLGIRLARRRRTGFRRMRTRARSMAIETALGPGGDQHRSHMCSRSRTRVAPPRGLLGREVRPRARKASS